MPSLRTILSSYFRFCKPINDSHAHTKTARHAKEISLHDGQSILNDDMIE